MRSRDPVTLQSASSRRRLRLGALVLALASVTQCTSGTEPEGGDDPIPSLPGVVTYQVVSFDQVGAVLVSVPAASVIDVPEHDILTEIVTRQSGDELFLAVVHRFGIEGLRFSLEVRDADNPRELTLREVVDAGNAQRDPSGYSVRVVQ